MEPLEDPTAVPQLGHFLSLAQESLASALRAQSAGDYRGRLGQLLLDEGLISESQLDAALGHQRFECLRRCRLFTGLSEDELATIACMVHEHALEPGDILLEQGKQDEFVSIVIRGSIEVFRIDAEGEKTVLAVHRPGEHVGEMGYVSKCPPSASVQALEPTIVLRLQYDDLTECVDRIPALARAFWRIASARLHQINDLYEAGTQRQKAAERSLQHLYSFLDLTEAKLLGSGIEGLIESLVLSASRLVDADRATLFLIDPSTGELWSKVAEGEGMKEIRLPPGIGIAGWVAEHGTLENIQDVYTDPRFHPDVDRATNYRTRNMLCGPIVNLQNETIGVVEAINKSSGAFTKDDEQLFSLFSHQAAIAVENFSLYQRIMSNHQKMGMMLEISTTLNETLNLGELIGLLVTKITKVLDCDRCSFFVYDRKTEELWSLQAVGVEYKELRFPASSGLAGFSARSGETLNVNDAYEDLRFNPEFDQRSGYRTRSVLCVPVTNREGIVTSVVQAINKRTGRFEQEDEDLLRAISAQIGVAVENSKLHADTLGMKNYLEGVQTSISSAIVTLDEENRIVTANQAAIAMLELPESRMAGLPLGELLGAENGYLVGLISQVQRTRAATMQYDVLLRKNSGRDGVINLNVLPLTTNGDDSGGVVIIAEDVSAEKQVRRMLTRYMDKEVVDRVLEDPRQQTLGGKRSEASVLFCDIRNFTSVAEELPAEDAMDLLNDYFSIMVADVVRTQGMLDKFIGDALLAVFGLPFAREDDAVRAVTCAVAMRRSLAKFNAARAAVGKPPIRNGIGINTGDVISGNLGAETRMDYTVIGDSVNVASRLEKLTKVYGSPILIAGSTHALIGDAFVTRRVDRMIPRGRSHPVEIFEVIGPAGCDAPTYLDAFNEGFKLYEDGHFEKALDHFCHGAKDDQVSRLFAVRCQSLITSPPNGNWNGVWRMENK